MGLTRGFGFPRPPREALSAVLTRAMEGRGSTPRLERNCRELAPASTVESGPGRESLLGGAFLAVLRAPAPRELEKFSQRRG